MLAEYIAPGDRQMYHILMAAMYIFGLLFFLYGGFAAVRTATTRLPVPKGDPAATQIMPLEVGPRLRHLDGRVRRAWKFIVCVGLFLSGMLTLLSVTYITYRSYDPWYGWGLADDRVIFAFHWLASIMLAALVMRRGRTHANRYPGLKP